MSTASSPLFYTVHDGKVHDPLGAAAYIFCDGIAKPYLQYLGILPEPTSSPQDTCRAQQMVHNTLIIHIGAQPNNSPHTGTITVFALAFIVARLLRRTYIAEFADNAVPHDLRVIVQLDLVDTAPDDSASIEVDGIVYQRSHRNTNAMAEFLPDYKQLLDDLAAFVGHEVGYKIETQETLMHMPGTSSALQRIIADRARVTAELAPGRACLAIRCACPVCGYADKHGKRNEYDMVDGGPAAIVFHCHDPIHASYRVSLADADQVAKLEVNTPLRNLVRTLACMEDTASSLASGEEECVHHRVHMRVTGADYAGTYQEQLLWRQLMKLTKLPAERALLNHPPVILYAPLILDWAGSKLSKSLYVVDGAYDYMKEERGYLLSFAQMRREGKDHRVLFREVERWVNEPKKLFRSWTVEYIHRVFEEEDGKVDVGRGNRVD